MMGLSARTNLAGSQVPCRVGDGLTDQGLDIECRADFVVGC